jgi:hypothetical protein
MNHSPSLRIRGRHCALAGCSVRAISFLFWIGAFGSLLGCILYYQFLQECGKENIYADDPECSDKKPCGESNELDSRQDFSGFVKVWSFSLVQIPISAAIAY